MSIYERRGLSTNKALPNTFQMEYTGSSPRIKWDVQSCSSQCTKIFDLSTKFKSRTWTTLRSFLNLFVSAQKSCKKWLEVIEQVEIYKLVKWKWKSTWNRPTSCSLNEQGSSLASQLPLTRMNSLVEFLLESGRHEMSHTLLSYVFK